MQKIRHIAGQTVGGILAGTGIVSWRIANIQSIGLITNIYFHQPSSAVFRGCVSWLMRRGYRFIATSELEESLYNNKKLPPLSVHVSLDDAWRSNLTEVVPVAHSLDIPITIFVPTEPIISGYYWWTRVENFARDHGQTVERLKQVADQERRAIIEEIAHNSELPREAMTRDELRTIASLKQVTIGSHTMTHPVLTNCSDAILEYELEQSKSTLEDWLGKEVTAFAYPNGDFGERERRAVERAGYRSAFTIRQQFQRPGKYNPLALPRFALPNDTATTENIARVTGLWSSLLSFRRFTSGARISAAWPPSERGFGS